MSDVGKDFVAGTLSGISHVCAVYPLDTIKTRLQTQSSTSKQFNGIIDGLRKTVRFEGYRALYRGMSSPLAGSAFINAVTFGAYGQAKRVVADNRPTLTLRETILCGGFAGLVSCIVVCPLELVKSRLQVQSSVSAESTSYKGPIDVVRKVFRGHGLRGFFQGIGPTICREIPGTAAWYGAFEYMKQKLSPDSPPSLSMLVLSGASAGVAYWAACYPQDVIKSIMQTQHNAQRQYRTAVDCTLSLVNEEGVKRLYKGFSAAIARGVPGAAVTFTVFTIVKDALSK